MMISRLRIAPITLLFGVLGSPGIVASYDVRTHGEITRAAFEKSQGTREYLSAVGLRTTDTFKPNDVAPARLLAGFDNTGTPQDWMIEGAIREDDLAPHPGLQALGCTLPESPPSPI